MIPFSSQRDIVQDFIEAHNGRFSYKDIRKLQGEHQFNVMMHITELINKGRLTQEDREAPDGTITTTFIVIKFGF